MIAAAHQTMLAPQGAPYRLLDYIEGDGAQFIDTGYKIGPTDTLDFEIAFGTITDQSDKARFIGRVQRPNIVYQISTTSGLIIFQYFANTTGADTRITSVSNTWFRFRADAGTKKLTTYNAEGSVITTTYAASAWPTGASTVNLILFRRYDVATCFDGKCRRFTVEGKHDWNAALDPNGRPCMVDLIDPANPAYLYNGGTGEFVPGPDK